jgi:hypothetical protein
MAESISSFFAFLVCLFIAWIFWKFIKQVKIETKLVRRQQNPKGLWNRSNQLHLEILKKEEAMEVLRQELLKEYQRQAHVNGDGPGSRQTADNDNVVILKHEEWRRDAVGMLMSMWGMKRKEAMRYLKELEGAQFGVLPGKYAEEEEYMREVVRMVSGAGSGRRVG